MDRDTYIPLLGAAGGASLPAASFLQYRFNEVPRFRRLVDSIREDQLVDINKVTGNDLRDGSIATTVRRPDYTARGLLNYNSILDVPKRIKGQSLKAWLLAALNSTEHDRFAKYLGTGSVFSSGLPIRHGFGIGSGVNTYHAGSKEVFNDAVDMLDAPDTVGEYAMTFRHKGETKDSINDARKYIRNFGLKTDYDGRGGMLEGLKSILLPRIGARGKLSLDQACALGDTNCGTSISRTLRMHGPMGRGQLPGQVALHKDLILDKVITAGGKPSLESVKSDMHNMLKSTMRGRTRLGLLGLGMLGTGGALAGAGVNALIPD